jgi:RYK receptor-like tyrosine kinase
LLIVIAWEIMTDGATPYGDLPPFEAATSVMHGKLKLEVPKKCPEGFSLLQKCWTFNPQERPTIQDLFDQLSTIK